MSIIKSSILTKPSSCKALTLNFTSKVQRRQPLNFEVLNRKSNREKVAIGSVMLDLNQIMQQDEYEVLLEIPEENNANIISTIHTKITFIWSFYKFYEDQYTKSQKNIKAYESLLEKTTTLLNNLNGKSSKIY